MSDPPLNSWLISSKLSRENQRCWSPLAELGILDDSVSFCQFCCCGVGFFSPHRSFPNLTESSDNSNKMLLEKASSVACRRWLPREFLDMDVFMGLLPGWGFSELSCNANVCRCCWSFLRGIFNIIFKGVFNIIFNIISVSNIGRQNRKLHSAILGFFFCWKLCFKANPCVWKTNLRVCFPLPAL